MCAGGVLGGGPGLTPRAEEKGSAGRSDPRCRHSKGLVPPLRELWSWHVPSEVSQIEARDSRLHPCIGPSQEAGCRRKTIPAGAFPLLGAVPQEECGVEPPAARSCSVPRGTGVEPRGTLSQPVNLLGFSPCVISNYDELE